jgi:hypothetical protein
MQLARRLRGEKIWIKMIWWILLAFIAFVNGLFDL